MGAGETYTNLQAAMAAMSSGDELIIRDGTYTGATNAIDSTHKPPSGPGTGTGDARFTIIRAENPGSVVFDGESTRNMLYLAGTSLEKPYNLNWIKFDGIEWTRAISTSGHVAEMGLADHLMFTRCGFSDAVGSGNPHNCLMINYLDDSLFEDCYSYGNGNYNFMIYQLCDNVIFRRCVARHDRYTLWDSPAAFACYSSGGDIVLQNCIVIDSDQYTYNTGSDGNPYPFRCWQIYDPWGNGTKLQLTGCIALNNSGLSAIVASSMQATSEMHFDNCIVNWNSIAGGVVLTGDGTVDFDHCLLGKISSTGKDVYGFDYIQHGLFAASNVYDITNSIIEDCTDADAYGLVYATSDYNCLWGNTANYSGTSAGAHDIDDVDPEAGSLEYLIRVEGSSALDGAASDSGDIGPTITKQVGASGTLYGETGWDTVTETDLWPFPNEATIKSKFAAYSYDSGNLTGARGFAAAGKQLNGTDDITLTSYVWEYLGNEIPADVYGEDPDTTPPTSSGVSGSGVSRQ